MRESRLKQIEQYIVENNTVSLEDISQKFNVSINTVRRDVAYLLNLGGIEKIYGGVCVKRKKSLVPFEQRNISNMELKRQIGLRAADFISDGDVIFIDSGTTTLNIIDGLKEKTGITVITNNLSAIVSALPYKGINIITTTGQLDRKTNSFLGANTVKELETYNIKKCFMAATGFSISNGITNSSLFELEIKSTVVQRSEQVFLLLDSTKFGVSSLTTYAQPCNLDYVITDKMPPNEYIEICRKNDVQIISCK